MSDVIEATPPVPTSLAVYLDQYRAPLEMRGKWATYADQVIYETNTTAIPMNDWLREASSNLPGWYWLHGLCLRAAGANSLDDLTTNIHPDDVMEVAKALTNSDDPTVEEFVNFANLYNKVNSKKLISLISNSPPTLPPLRVIQTPELFTRILAATNQNYGPDLFKGNVWLEDTDYQLLTDEALDLLCSKCPSKKFKWVAESRDCDDISRIVWGWLSQAGYGNVTVFVASIWAIGQDGNPTGDAHSVLLCVTETRVVIWEGQNGIHNLDKNYYPQAIGAGVSGIVTVGNQIYRLDM